MLQILAAASITALTLLAAPLAASAQVYPDRAIRLVVPFPPGGPTDVAGRIVAEYLTSEIRPPGRDRE